MTCQGVRDVDGLEQTSNPATRFFTDIEFLYCFTLRAKVYDPRSFSPTTWFDLT